MMSVLLVIGVPVLFGAAFWLLVPMQAGLQLGPDEGYELMKSLLLSRGHRLYDEVWNDQPPLHTVFLAFLFKLGGPSAYVARLATLSLAMIFVSAFAQTVRQQESTVVVSVATLLLITGPSFVELSGSAMLELPAMVIGWLAVMTARECFRGKRMWWLLASGALMGVALQTKLTAAIYIPCLAAECYLTFRTNSGPLKPSQWTTYRMPLSALLVWSIGVGAVSVAVSIVFNWSEALTTMGSSHFSTRSATAVAGTPDIPRWSVLGAEVPLYVAAIIGVIVRSATRSKSIIVPTVLLLTTVGVHALHKPFWEYYRLHFAAPLAWLASIGVVELGRALWRESGRRSGTYGSYLTIGGLALWVAAVGSLVSVSVDRIVRDVGALRRVKAAVEDPLVIELKRYSSQTQWVFTDRPIYAFWANLPVIPQVAVLPLKRVWANEVSDADILRRLEEYRPEQIVLAGGWANSERLAGYIGRYYVRSTVPALEGIGPGSHFVRKPEGRGAEP